MTWTTEQVAEHLGITVDEVYTSRRRGDFPGNLGVRRGKRLVFNPDQVENPPEKDGTTSDVMLAVLWELQAHANLLRRVAVDIHHIREHISTDHTADFHDHTNCEWTKEREEIMRDRHIPGKGTE